MPEGPASEWIHSDSFVCVGVIVLSRNRILVERRAEGFRDPAYSRAVTPPLLLAAQEGTG